MPRYQATPEANSYYNSIKGLDPEKVPVIRYKNSVYGERPGTPLVDYIIYKCPVRGVRVFALEDAKGRYWCGMDFVTGGWVYYNYDRDDEDNSHSYIVSEEFLPEAASRLIRNLVNHDCWQGLTTNHRRTGPNICVQTTHPMSANHPGTIPYYDQIRAQLIYEFDKEYGGGAYFKSQGAARARHARMRSSRVAKANRMADARDDVMPEI